MLETTAFILILAWLLGVISSYTMNGYIHVFLGMAILLILVRLVRGKRAHGHE